MASLSRFTLAAAALFVAVAPSAAAPAPAAAPSTATTAADTLPPLEPAAKEALVRAGAFLRSLKSFELTTTGSSEEVLGSGQKLTYPGTIHYAVATPDKLFLETVTDRQQRRYYYDGKKVTVEVPRVKLYTDAALPGTIATLIAAVDAKYGIDLPLQDLFLMGTPKAVVPTSGFRVGPALINGVKTDHYAFRQPGVDWQIWIAQGDKPLPMKFVITGTDDPAHPQTEATLTWDLAPNFAADRFTYTPPAGTARMAILSTDGSTGGK